MGQALQDVISWRMSNVVAHIETSESYIMAGIHEPVMSWLVEVYKGDDKVFGEALQLLRERDQVSVYTLYVH